MESANNNNLNTGLVEEDANVSAFRRRNNIIVFILICFILSLILIMSSSIFYMNLHYFSHPDRPPPLNPALAAYCSFRFAYTSWHINIFNSIVNIQSVTNPNQIFTLSLETAAKELENLTLFMLSNYDAGDPAFRNCSDSLRTGSGQLRGVLAAMRVNPFVESLSEEVRSDMAGRILMADDSLMSCLDDLATVGSTAASELREKVYRLKVYVIGGGNFLYSYDVVLQDFWSYVAAAPDWRSVVFEYLVFAFVCVLYLWFIFYFIRALCRFLGVRSFSLDNALRACLVGKLVYRRRQPIV